MSSSPKQNRIEFIKAIVGEEVTKIVTEVVVGDVPSESAIKVSGTVSQSTLRRVSFLNSLANLCDDNETFVKAVANDPDIISVRHLALLYNKQRLGELFSSQRAAVVSQCLTPLMVGLWHVIYSHQLGRVLLHEIVSRRAFRSN
jgi:hypothetical protein